MASAEPQNNLFPAFARLQLHGGEENRRPASFDAASPDMAHFMRPDAPRRSTDPSLDTAVTAAPRPRTRSPFSRGHMRSQSAGLSAPPMARTRSLPTVTFTNFGISSSSSSPARPSSPLRPPPTSRGSPRRSFEEVRPLSSGTGTFTEIESIAEDSELDFSTARTFQTPASPTPSAPNSVSFHRSNSGRRRPTSPLHQQATVAEHSLHGSPQMFSVSKFNEPFPTASSTGSLSYSAASSIPSTPTSIRSRSPSISSLDTIEDSPDAEEEAAEQHHLARLKAAADAAEAAEAEAETERKLRAVGVEAPADARPAAWSPQHLKEKRKRWSVCGAERRGDFEMETIWED